MAETGLAKDTPEAVAYQLLQHVLDIEKPALDHAKQRWGAIRRGVILDLYAECLEAVLGQRKPKATSKLPVIESKSGAAT